jgi:hypothetical protein
MKVIFIQGHRNLHWRIIIPPRLTGTGKRECRFFETEEQANEAIQMLPRINALKELEIEANIESIMAAIEKLNGFERYNLLRRLNRSAARERRQTCLMKGKKITVNDRPKSSIRYQTNLQYKLRTSLSNRLNELVKAGQANGGRIIDLLGCTIPEFMTYLEGQFVEGMAWNNYGPVWHIDHIRPCSSFDLRDPEQQKRCFHWTNLKALLAIENLRKGKNLISFVAGRSNIKQ